MCNGLLRFLFVSACMIAAAAAIPQASAPSGLSHKIAASGSFKEASSLLAEGKIEKALGLVKDGLAKSPRSVVGLNLLGMIYNQQARYNDAVSQFQQALTIAPNSVETMVNLATCYASQNKADLAVQTFSKALRVEPGNRTANYNLGNLLLAQNRPKEALPYLLRIVQPDAATRLLLIQSYLDSGMANAGLSAAGRLSRAFPRDARVHFSVGVLLAAHKKYRQSAFEFEQADALQPGTFDILHDLGQAYFLSGQPAKAQDALNHALQIQPESADTLYWLAQTAAGMQKEIDALELLVRARKLAPANSDILFLMAQLSMKQSFFDDAIELLNEGLKIDPRRADFHAALGESYFTTGKVDKALEEFKTLISLDRSPRSYVFMGLCYRHLGQYEEAKRYFKQSLTSDRNNLPALFNLGFIARKEGDFPQAEQYLKRALRLDKDYPDPLFELASLNMDEKKYAGAVPLLRHFVEVSPSPADGYYKLAISERNLHQLDAAQRDMNVFTTLSKSPQPAPYPLQHFFDYLERRSTLTTEQQNETDLRALEAEVQQHPDRPRTLYLLAESLLKMGRMIEAMQALQRLDALSGEDFRTELNSGVLLGRFHLYADAIHYLQAALKIDPTSDEAKYNLGEAFFRSGNYDDALRSLVDVSPDGQKESFYLGLRGDVYARQGRYEDASRYLQQAIEAGPDDDQYYASLATVQVRDGEIQTAERTAHTGLARIPDSASLHWVAGIIAIVRGHGREAEILLKKAAQLSPSRQSVAATLGIFYYEEGRLSDAREVLKRCEEMFPKGALDFQKITAVLDAASTSGVKKSEELSPESRRQVYELALAMHDQEQ